jgi:hypothetical protein
MGNFDLLAKLAAANGPVSLHSRPEIADARRLSKSGYIEAKFDTPNKGRYAAGQALVAVVVRVTPAGLEELRRQKA